MTKPRIVNIGERFGMMTVLEELERIRDPLSGKLLPRYFKIRCDCGNETVVTMKHLTRNQSCGCGRRGRRSGSPYKKCLFPAPAGKCHHINMCCWECDEWETCEERCLNSPAKCGYTKLEVD